jgi:GT2 family glycosyltransferase
VAQIAIVILNWNGRHYLEKFLPSVVKYSSGPDIQLVVADNGSTDNSLSFIRQQYNKITIIEFDKNYGFAEGYNKALKLVNAKYYVLLNSDVEVTAGWLNPIIDLMEKDEKIAACMPKIRSYDRSEYFEYAGAAGGFIDKFGYPFCRGRILNYIEKDTGQYDLVREIFWASGTCLFIKSELFINSGGFDPDFFAHMEEIDLCWRLKNLGYKILYSPNSTIYHIGGGTLPNQHPRKLYLNFRNNLFLLYKNLPPKNLFPILFARLAFDIIAAFKFLFTFEAKKFCSVLKAHLEFYSKFGKYRKIRARLKTNVKNTIHSEIYRKSILYQFFILHKKTFQELDFSNEK